MLHYSYHNSARETKAHLKQSILDEQKSFIPFVMDQENSI